MFLRIAIKDKGELSQCLIEEENDEPAPGKIYKGIVKNIVPAIKCAFIDIGLNKNAYLYLDNKMGNISLKKGDEVIVEVIKEATGNKGAKVTTAYSIPGRYAVLVTLNNKINFSEKIKDKNFIRTITENIVKPEEVGIMIRTNAQNVSVEDINEEFQMLYDIYSNIISATKFLIKPRLLFNDEGILDRVLRDYINEATSKIVLNKVEDFDYVKDFISKKYDINVIPELYNERRSLFDFYGIEKQLMCLRSNRVNLPCGGNIVLDKTEAMYVIDVNSGKNVGNHSIQKTALLTNLQAAEEITKQIKLRNISGIIVVDFIDMSDEASKNQVMEVLKSGLSDDKNKTVIYPFTTLNLVQIARRRKGKSIHEYMEEACDECRGKGYKLKPSYLMHLIKNEILRLDSDNRIKDIYIEVNETFENIISDDILNFIKEIGGIDKKIYIKYSRIVEFFKVEPLIFMNQIQNVEKYKVYG
jgi:ribonuclease, Rne/Rng family